MFGKDVLGDGPKRKHNSGVVLKDKKNDRQDQRQQKSALLQRSKDQEGEEIGLDPRIKLVMADSLT